MTKFKLDLRNPMMYPYIKFELDVCKSYKDNERKLKISIFFFQTITKFELDPHIPMMYLYRQLQTYTYIQTKVRERELKISRGITL
jgi:hypothetical protein